MEWWQALILGLVEGITEYLPISSTGHLVIVSSLLGLGERTNADHKAAIDAFNIVVQGGAILAVLGLYWPRVVQMFRGLMGKDPAGFRLVVNLFVAFLPAAVAGLLLHNWIERHLFFTGPVVAALIVGGVYMMFIEQWRLGRFGRGPTRGVGGKGLGIEDVTLGKALFIGILQCFSLWPGTSRSMMTITGGIITGLRPAAAAEFSFLLGLPTLGAATLYSLYQNFSRTGIPITDADGNQVLTLAGEPELHRNLFAVLGATPVLIGIVVAAISAAVAIRWLVAYLNRSGLTAFGWYRIVLGLAIIGLTLGGLASFG